ncbi:SDR family NAD(P)-dependent oxidoreductase [Leucobacter aridicollis]|uniref:NAD(P)-dependent dehydrogenase (Short-subunit alcohol dehydrogenase family) n=1 Tax=Leucobacter aridicollis TaxID=283878 RepID=A0A852R8S5_9MICO|nr:SDR family oxidoreductase [Leucobacter aridicollis]MBL3682290.1 SDR family oxidoreductase [Leucobacter aridicollis]NYD25706.1 NAD(P)-dependent dehydrogenase (short-subunit alcohol dehydrogenase family) [Leucobacter aridicollis]
MSTAPVALVTGGTSGIGVVIAQQLVEAGHRVVVSGRSEQRGSAVAAELGDRARFVRTDLTATGAAADLISRTTETFGRLDVLVNNAAIDHTGELLEVGEAEIRTTFETNTFSAMNLLIAAARTMREQGDGGSIINITSRLASIGVPTMGIYSASKGAMLAFTKAAAIDLAPYNIRVNAVAPGMTRTPLYQEWLDGLPDPEAEARRVAEAIPLGRIAEPADVAAVVRFLASPEASYLTGASIPVEGGYLAK